jgi:hypothetical protein
MRQTFFIVIFIVIILLLLVGLNAASYVRFEQPIDYEIDPDRSTYNTGGSGTRAIYDYLQETGHKVTRWQESPRVFIRKGIEKPDTFVVIGRTKRRFEKEEITSLLAWVGEGGRLVIIDRFPDPALLPTNGNWRVSVYPVGIPETLRTDDQAEMTQSVKPVSPSQPTVLTQNIETIFPSRFIGYVSLDWTSPKTNNEEKKRTTIYSDDEDTGQPIVTEETEEPPPPILRPEKPTASVDVYDAEVQSAAPVVHFTSEGRPILIDYPYGTGRIILLSDPYMVSNAGIALADNQQLALNLIARRGGLIAFDEYHQGYGASQNRLISYFSNTPVLAITLQLFLLVLAVLWSSGKRFARPLPLPVPDRRSKLEYVASMADLQQSAKAYDLAIENIYMRLRRVLARYAGLETNSRTNDIATRVAARGKLDPHSVYTLMHQCEETINGEKINANKALSLIARLRELENKLGLRLRSREVRQLKEK